MVNRTLSTGSSTRRLEPAATKRGKGRPKHNIYDHERVCIEEPDYKEQDEASSTAPHPDTEEDQPVSVWASSLYSSHAGLQVAAAAAALIKRLSQESCLQ